MGSSSSLVMHGGGAEATSARRFAARVVSGLLVVAAAPGRAAAHAGHPPAPHDLWYSWSFEPWVVVPLLATAAMYAVGARRVALRARPSRIRRWRTASFAMGMVLTAVALVSPLDALGSALFAAHMTQHEMLIVLAAPLLVAGSPVVPLLWALPRGTRRRVAGWVGEVFGATWRALTTPATAFVLHAMALVGWHVPSAYQATLTSDAVHALQHASFVGTAILLWWSLIGSGPGRRTRHGAAVLCLFGTALIGSGLGALLTFSEVPWYPAYAGSTRVWGLTPLGDQQLGGLIMWIPAGVVQLPVALAFAASWARLFDRGASHRPHPASVIARDLSA